MRVPPITLFTGLAAVASTLGVAGTPQQGVEADAVDSRVTSPVTYRVHVTDAGSTEASARARGQWLVDSQTGATAFNPPTGDAAAVGVPGAYRLQLQAIAPDAQRTTVFAWDFEVLPRVTFGTTAGWNASAVLNASNGYQSMYNNTQTYTLAPPPLLPAVHFTGITDGNAHRVTYSMVFYAATKDSLRLPGFGLRPVIEDGNALSYHIEDDNALEREDYPIEDGNALEREDYPGRFFVDSYGGGLAKLEREGAFVGMLVAMYKGQRASVHAWGFEVQRPDVSEAAYGPGGSACENGAVPVDDVPFDRAYTCACSGAYTGLNCASKVEDAAVSKNKFEKLLLNVVAGVLAVVIVLGLLGIAYKKYKKHQKLNQAADFDSLMAKLVADGTLDDTVPGLKDMCPKELRRTDVTFIEQIGSGAFGEVWKATFRDHGNHGGGGRSTTKEYIVAAKTVLQVCATIPLACYLC